MLIMNKHHKVTELCVCVVTFREEDTVMRIYMLFTGREVRMGKNCARGLEYGLRPYSRPRAQFFPIRTDLAR